MNHLVKDAYGIDAVIKRIQEQIYPEFVERWEASINGYGRVYKNEREDRKVPEVFTSKENDYQDSFFDDNCDANFFFLASEESKTEDEMVYSNDIKIVFCMDLAKCYNGRTDRMDALAHKDAVDILRNVPSSGKYSITGYQTGLERIFSGFSIKGIKYDDMQPLHIFAVLANLNYSLTDKCT